jgi:hypothetical protein
VAAAKAISGRGYGLALGFVLEGGPDIAALIRATRQQKSGREAALMR